MLRHQISEIIRETINLSQQGVTKRSAMEAADPKAPPSDGGNRSTSSHNSVRIGRDANDAGEFAPAIVRCPPMNLL